MQTSVGKSNKGRQLEVALFACVDVSFNQIISLNKLTWPNCQHWAQGADPPLAEKQSPTAMFQLGRGDWLSKEVFPKLKQPPPVLGF